MNLKDLKSEYLKKCTNFIKENDGKIFKCKEEFYHFNHAFVAEDESHSSDLLTGAYAKIIGYQNDGTPIVRMLAMEQWHRLSYVSQKTEGSIIINLRNWTGYSFSLLSDIIEEFIEDENTLPQFVLDSFYKDDTDMVTGKWRISYDDFDNNVRPWLERKNRY